LCVRLYVGACVFVCVVSECGSLVDACRVSRLAEDCHAFVLSTDGWTGVDRHELYNTVVSNAKCSVLVDSRDTICESKTDAYIADLIISVTKEVERKVTEAVAKAGKLPRPAPAPACPSVWV